MLDDSSVFYLSVDSTRHQVVDTESIESELSAKFCFNPAMETPATCLPSLLIIDDEAPIVASLSYFFAQHGFEVHAAKDGETGLAMALKISKYAPLSTIILDVMMPKTDGYQLCQQLRSMADFRRTTIILLSAKSREADIQKGIEAGANVYLTKPFSLHELLMHISPKTNGLISPQA
jgi:CheY-like chemotaxis protein